MKQRILSIAIYGLSLGLGATAFIYPFLLPSIRNTATGLAHANDSPLVLTALVGLCFVVLLLEVQSQAVNTKLVALLGVLVSMNAALRFLEVAIPGPGGISPIFFLIIMTGYVYGARLGFLMGSLTMLVSALITGTIGPWLPYQMFTAGWIGMSATLCSSLVKLVRGRERRFEVLVLIAFAGLWGLIYGGIMNIWFWPFAVGPSGQYWEAGISFLETLKRYAAFYLTTSLAWDVLRATGNMLMVLAFAAPTLRVLRRFQRRFSYSHQPAHEAEVSPSLLGSRHFPRKQSHSQRPAGQNAVMR